MKEYKQVMIEIMLYEKQDVITLSDQGVHIQDGWEERSFFD